MSFHQTNLALFCHACAYALKNDDHVLMTFGSLVIIVTVILTTSV